MEEVPRRTSLVPLAFPCFCTLFNRGGNRRAFTLPGVGGGSFPLYGGTFARSYAVSTPFFGKRQFSLSRVGKIASRRGQKIGAH